MTKTRTLLADYVDNGSEAAFRELVARYIDLVYSTALRLVGGDAQFAQDATQMVFIHLAGKARSLPDDVMLGGWLHKDACHTALTLLRGERRRQNRERQAMEMREQQDHSKDNLADIAPVLDEAIGQLAERDRIAIILRYFERRDLRSVGEALGASENAAQKRISRALDDLRLLLKRRGVVLSSSAIGTALAAEAVKAAPAGLAGIVSGAALAGASAAAGGGAGFTLVKLMTISKLKIGILGALALAGVTTPLVIEHQTQARMREENQALRGQIAPYAPLRLENERLSRLAAQTNGTQPVSNSQFGDLLRLRGEVGMLRRQNKELERRREEARQLHAAATQNTQIAPARKVQTVVHSTDLNPSTPINATFEMGQLRDAGNVSIESAAQTALWALLNRDSQGMDRICYHAPSDTETNAANRLFGLEKQARCFDGIQGIKLRFWASDGDNQRMVPFNAIWPGDSPSDNNRPDGGTLIFRRGDAGWYLDQFIGQRNAR